MGGCEDDKWERKSLGVSLVMRVRVEKVQLVSIELAYFCSFCLCIG